MYHLLTFLPWGGESKGYVIESCPEFSHSFGLPTGGHSHKPDVHDARKTQLTHLLRGLAIHVPALPEEKKEGRREEEEVRREQKSDRKVKRMAEREEGRRRVEVRKESNLFEQN